jgi:uncharacterized protein (TIGR03435 family)
MERVRQCVCVVAWLAGALAAHGRPPQATTAGATAPNATPVAQAQGAATNGAVQPLAFDVVSIKQYPKNDLMIRIRTTPDGVEVHGMPMHMILREAFGVTNSQLLGEPDWVNTERYELEAKVAPDDAPRLKQISNDDRWVLLLPVLEDRCKLKFHHETRQITVYTLVVAKGGIRMQPSPPPGSAPAAPGPGGGPPLPPSPSPGNAGGIFFTARSATMPSLVRMLSRTLGSPVVDKTGLTGKYDYVLQFAPDESVRANMSSGPGSGMPPPESDGPSIFTAVQEQLGLKLEARKEAVDVVVIDHMEQPTVN